MSRFSTCRNFLAMNLPFTLRDLAGPWRMNREHPSAARLQLEETECMENFSEPIELLVIDENHEVVKAIKACFPHPRYHCVTATRATLALGVLRESQFHVVLCSTHLPSMEALRVLRRVLATNPQAIFLLLSDSLDPMLEA